MPRERLAVVEKKLLSCEPHRRIERDLAKQWGVARRQIREYIKRVYDDWGAGAGENPNHMRERIRSGFEEILRRALKSGEVSAAVTAQDRLARLAAAYPSELVQIDNRISLVSTALTPSQERLEELRARQEQKQLEAAPVLELVEPKEGGE